MEKIISLVALLSYFLFYRGRGGVGKSYETVIQVYEENFYIAKVKQHKEDDAGCARLPRRDFVPFHGKKHKNL